jgi:hypothetical protein
VACTLGILRLWQRELHEDQAVRGQSHVDGLKPQQTARQEAGCRHNRDGERDLRHHERAAAILRRGPNRAAIAAPQLCGQVGTR